MTKKVNLYKEQQQKKKALPVNRHGKPSPIPKGKRSVKPSKQTKKVDVEKGKRSAKTSKKTKVVDGDKGKRSVKPSKQINAEDVDEAMPEVEGSSQPQANAPQPPVEGKSLVTFDIFGSPVGPESVKFTSFVGKCIKRHVRITYETWKLVPQGLKDRLWEAITDVYEVPSRWREKVLARASISWKAYKSKLRDSRIYKHTGPLEEIKKDNPPNIKVEDWALFVDQAFTSKALKMRAQAQEARTKNVSLHRCGRTGAARIRYKMEQENPGKKIERTELFLGIHTRQDGTSLNEEFSRKLDQIQEIVENDPSSVSLDVDHDPVAVVYGKDTRGCVRGYGTAVSKTVLKGLRPIIDQLGMQNEMDPLEEQRVRDMVREIISKEFGHCPDLGSPVSATTQMRPASMQNHTSKTVTEDVDLLDLTGTVVALGKATMPVGGGGPYMCDVVLEKVIEPTTPVALDPAKRTMSQVDVGGIIKWPTGLLKKHCFLSQGSPPILQGK